jgi:hypothetical protein
MKQDKIDFIWHTDKTGAGSFVLVSASYGANEVASWLDNDIQEPISLGRWIQRIAKADQGLDPDYDVGFGNAHMTALVKNKIFIYCEYVEGQSVLMTTQQLLPVLHAYRDFFEQQTQGRYRDESDVPPSIPVEYLAEGDEAIALYEALEGSYGMPI